MAQHKTPPAPAALQPVPVPGMTPPTEHTFPGGRSVAYVWAFRVFGVLFLLVILAGLLNYLFSQLKYRTP